MNLAEDTGDLTGAGLAVRGESRTAASRDDRAGEVADVLGFRLVHAAREGIAPPPRSARNWGGHLWPDVAAR